YLPAITAAIALAFTILLIVYSAFLSKAKYIGNFVVASGTAFTLVFGASLIGKFEVVAFLAIAALFANLARELIKDLQDVKQDTGFKKSLPMLLSEKKVIGIVFFYYLIAIVTVYLPILLVGFASIYFISIVSVANLLFLLSFAKAVQRKFSRAQALSKIAMLVALIGFLAGVL
ncbi:MAG: UbiA family prenyltransferase, partial [Candidatus Diapherotrites archaeon]|nr:UbiA family prenyltransferase [Candidatus Diapherotrites archaeon]